MWRDRIVGIVLGLLLGAGIVAVFVFVYSEETIDAPSISTGGSDGGGHGGRHAGGGSKPGSVEATVPVLGGAPPESGPAHVDANEDDAVTLAVQSDAPVTVQLIGYGITQTLPAGTTPIRFKATQTGNFALINTATHIAVAQIRVDPR